MTALIPACAAAARLEDDPVVDEAELAAAAFLSRYRGRTLDAYRSDLRRFFQWATDTGLEVLRATRPQIELYVRALEARGLAATTIDRHLSTICGYYRFAHIDGRIPSNPAQYVRRPKIHPSEARGLDRGELGAFLFTAARFDRSHAALAALLGLNGLRVSEAWSTDIENLGFERGHRTLRIIGKGDKPAVIPLVPRTARIMRDRQPPGWSRRWDDGWTGDYERRCRQSAIGLGQEPVVGHASNDLVPAAAFVGEIVTAATRPGPTRPPTLSSPPTVRAADCSGSQVGDGGGGSAMSSM